VTATQGFTDLELRMTIKTLAAKGQSQCATARQLDLYEGTIPYYFWCIVGGTPMGARVRCMPFAGMPSVRMTLIFDKARCCTNDNILRGGAGMSVYACDFVPRSEERAKHSRISSNGRLLQPLAL
jgi:hypothetical protein